MNTKKRQSLKKLSFIGFSLLSLLLLSESESTAMSASSRSDRYRETHNRIATKHKLDHRILPSKASPHVSDGGHAEQFRQSAAALRKKLAEQDTQVSDLGVATVEVGGALAQNVIEKNVKDEKAKSALLQLKDKAVSFLKSFF